MKTRKERYFEIIWSHTGEVIGVCTYSGLEDVIKENPDAKFAEIDEKLFDIYNNCDNPWANYKGKPVNIRTQLIIESAE